jgi:large repetitive protein
LEPAQLAPFKPLNQNLVPINISALPIPTTDTTPPGLINDNPLSVQFGATATITSGLLAATDPDNSGAQLTYTVVNAPSYGKLLKSGARPRRRSRRPTSTMV